MKESMICGSHQYKAIWENPVAGEVLVCECEVDDGIILLNGLLGSRSSLLEVFFCMGRKKMHRTKILHDTGSLVANVRLLIIHLAGKFGK